MVVSQTGEGRRKANGDDEAEEGIAEEEEEAAEGREREEGKNSASE